MRAYLEKRWLPLLYVAFLILTFVFFLQAGSSGENYHFTQYDEILFKDSWDYVFSDGASGKTELPANLKAGKVDSLVLTNRLPELREGTVFIYRSRHADTKIYIDGKMKYDQLVQTADGSAVKDTWFPLPGNVWVEVPLSEEDSGKEIRIENSGFSQKYLKQPGTVYLGERGTFVLRLLQERMGTIARALLLLLLSIVLFVLWLILVITTRATAYRDCLCLALFTFSLSLWEFTETRCLQFVFPNMRMLGLLAYEILALAPVPIAMYYGYRERKKTVALSKVAAAAALSVWFVNNALHFLHIADISQTLIVTQIMDVFEVLLIGYIQVGDIIYEAKEGRIGGRAKYWWLPLAGIAIFVPLMLMELMRYMFQSHSFLDDASLMSFGVIAYIISLAFDSVMRLVSENQQVTEANQAKTQFLANMSHEIRTPLNAVLGFNEMILREAKDENILQYASSIKNAGASLRDTVNTVLDLSKIESGKIEIIEAEYSVVQLLDDVSSMVTALAEKKGLSIVLEVDENLPKTLKGDEVHIRQILVNLLTNAVKYTDKGQVTFQVRVTQEIKETKDCDILFSVKDTGIGIREEDQARIFDKFERLHYEGKHIIEGTGLGMSIVVILLDAMQSKIQLKSTYGIGSEFFFVLRQKAAGEEKVGNYEMGRSTRLLEQGREYYTAPSARILIVDDVPLNLQVTCGLLAGLKMQIDTAESGQQAIEMVKENRYDLILMDHMMPEMDGIEATKRIRKLAATSGDPYYAEIPVLALTANALSGMKEKFLEEGMQDFISKPVEGKELERVLYQWLPKEKIIPGNEKETEAAETEEDWEIPIEGLDMAEAKKYASGREMFLDMLHSYLSASPATRERIKAFSAEQDQENYTIAVHGLKSASKVIGAMEISEAARRLEEMAQAGKFKEAWEETPHLLELCRNMENAIRECFSEEKTAAAVNVSEEEMREILRGLRESAEAFDVEAFLGWEKQMEHMEVEEAYAEKWQELKLAVGNLAFSDVLDIIEQI